jgi:GntR family transcriptional regulator
MPIPMKKPLAPPIPAYYKLQVTIQNDIETGRWKPGESIPTEKTLAEQHQVSVGTVKKALLNLSHGGFLYRIQGKGTFVANTRIIRENARYYRFLRRFGDEEADLEMRLVGFSLVKGIEHINRFFNTDRDPYLYEIKRLLIIDQKPSVYLLSYLPRTIFRDLEKLPKNIFETTPLYIAVEEQYGLPTLHNQELFGAVAASADLAEVLNIKEGAPVLKIEMLSLTYKDEPYEYRESYCCAEHRKIFRAI